MRGSSEDYVSADFDELTRRISRTVVALHQWHAICVLGILRHLPAHERRVVDEQAARTLEILEQWNTQKTKGL